MNLLDLHRTLSSFDPPRAPLAAAPWEPYVDWAIENGLAPLAAYNLEYRLAGSNAPEWVRDRLLSVYQGAVNDNVMKLVSFKRAVAELDSRLLLLGGAGFADALYPHIAFRPLLHLRLLVPAADAPAVDAHLAAHGFRPAADVQDVSGASRRLSDGRTDLLIHDRLLPGAHDPDLFTRAHAARAYGAAVFRLDLEDAILVQCLLLGRAGYVVPQLSFLDLRELLLGAPSLAGPYSRPFDAAAVRARAKLWRLERTVHVALAIVARLFPETAPFAAEASPPLRPATRALLGRLVVDPVSDVGPARPLRGVDRLRRLLSGAR